MFRGKLSHETHSVAQQLSKEMSSDPSKPTRKPQSSTGSATMHRGLINEEPITDNPSYPSYMSPFFGFRLASARKLP